MIRTWMVCAFSALWATHSYAAAGREAASFLDIPVGAGPAALGSAYTALATDAYAPVWNAAGLAQLDSVQAAGMHLPYIQSVRYEYLGIAVPFDEKRQGIGMAIQYLGSGDIPGRDEVGNPTAPFSTTFAAYSLAYGRRLTDDLSIGGAAKVITEKISDASGKAYAADVGLLYQLHQKLRLGASLTNVGSSLKLVNEPDPLPTAFHGGALWRPSRSWDVCVEGVYRREGPFGASFGAEYKSGEAFSLRVGYDTSRTKELGALAGVRGGVALFWKGQEFSYAASPFGDLGTAQYLSVVVRFTTKDRADRPKGDSDHSSSQFDDTFGNFDTHYNLDDILSPAEKKSLWK